MSRLSLRDHLALGQRADARDDLARAFAVGRNVVERRPRFRDVRRLGGEPARACASAGDHPPQGLADLVGDRGGQLAERRQPRHVRELRAGGLQRMVLLPQPLLRELALGDVARQRQVEHAVSLTKHAAADLDREHGPVAATMPGLERDRLAGAGPLREPRNRLLIERDIEIAGVHADQLVAGETEAFAGLAVHVDHGHLVVEQEEGIRRAVDEGAKTRLARAQVLLGPPQLGDVLHHAELADRMAGLVRGHVALAVDHAQLAVGAHHPVLHVIAADRPARPPRWPRRLGSIVRMDQAEPPPVPLRHVDGLHAEDAARLVRQGDAPGPVVALPPPDMRDALRRFEAALAVAQVADGQEAAQGIGQTPADLAEQALLVVGPAARLRALVQAQQIGVVLFGMERHGHVRADPVAIGQRRRQHGHGVARSLRGGEGGRHVGITRDIRAWRQDGRERRPRALHVRSPRRELRIAGMEQPGAITGEDVEGRIQHVPRPSVRGRGCLAWRG